VAKESGITLQELNEQQPIGKSGLHRSVLKRAIRWHQQTLKSEGILEKTDKRGIWSLSEKGKQQLHKINPDFQLVAFSTKLGIAIWGDCRKVFDGLDTPIALVVSSPPYPIQIGRHYGSVSTTEYTDFICDSLESIVKNLMPGGSIALNVSNDIFEKGLPSRSIYLEKLTIALVERLGLHLMDRLIWQSNKPPGPTYWACVNRVQLSVAYEHILWFTNDPAKVFSDNRRVLQPHSSSHLALINRGGETREASYSDGAHRIRKGSFGNATDGSIAKNVLKFANTCHSQREFKKICHGLGLPVHGAPMPLELAKFLIQFLTPECDHLPVEERPLVIDHFAGSLTVPYASEILGRLWAASEVVWEFLRAGGERFRDVEWTPDFFSALR